ncbi:MAG: DUF3604 domain-containing protein [Pirellulaceae bacterium]
MRLTTGYGPGKPEIWHAADLPRERRQREHGSGSVEIQPTLVAGQWTTVRFQFRIGQLEIPEGGQIAVAWRWPFDWSDLQSDDPAADGFVKFDVKSEGGSSGDVKLRADYTPYGGIEPYHHVLSLTVEHGRLKDGEVVSIVCGEQASGGRGWRAPTCAIKQMHFLLLVDPKGQQRWTELPRCEPSAVVAGPVERLVAVAPSDAVVDEPITLIVRAEDAWGNPTVLGKTPRITGDSLAAISPGDIRVIDDPPALHLQARFTTADTLRVHVAVPSDQAAGKSHEAESNPIRVHAQAPSLPTFWGDLHSGQTLIGCGSCTIADHYAYGRDAAGLQFITHQANDHYVTVADWQETRDETERFHKPGRYVTILGCEWSPYTPQGGDRNVFYNYDEPLVRRSDRFFTESVPDDTPDLPAAPEFLEVFRELDVLINMHVGGRMTNLDWHEPCIEKLAEIHSTHGTVEWFFIDCLRRGYRVAVTAGTDGVMGRPGADHPGSRLIRNVSNGLTAVMARELTREGLWEALHARRTYATTGERILLEVTVDGHAMGESVEVGDRPKIEVLVEGTAPIEQIDVLRGAEVIHSWTPALDVAGSDDDERLLRLLWGGTTECGTARQQRVVWDGSLEIDGAELEVVAPIGFQTPLDIVDQSTPGRVAWKSVTAGNEVGLLLRIRGEPDAKCRFAAAPGCFEFRLGDVQSTPRTFSAGGFSRHVSIGPAPNSSGSRQFRHSHVDSLQEPGDFPYWVRAIQVDRHKAWSTPVYASRPAD